MYHLSFQIIRRGGGKNGLAKAAYNSGNRLSTRSKGTGVLAKAAYRAGGKLTDQTTGMSFDYRNKARDGGVLGTALVFPATAPAWTTDLAARAAQRHGVDLKTAPALLREQLAREELWTMVEAQEKRPDAQLAREAQIMLPRELTDAQNMTLLLAFVDKAFVGRGMVADVAFHMETASDGLPQPHAHVLLSMRALGPDGFGLKRREWNDKALVYEWRKLWADMANDALEQAGHARRLDHRSLQDRGIQMEPDLPQGPTKTLRDRDGVVIRTRKLDNISDERDARKMTNLAKLARDPDFVLEQISRTQATFTRADVARFVHRYCAVTGQDDFSTFTGLVERAMQSHQLVALGDDKAGAPRFSTRELVECEARLAATAHRLAARAEQPQRVLGPGRLSAEQEAAANYLVQSGDLACLVGYAGSGKTHLLAEVVAHYQAEGRRVRGAALAAVAAKNLADGSNIEASTVASLLYKWDHRDDAGRLRPIDPLQQGDVLIVDEAAMVGARDMLRLVQAAETADAKIILVGDAQQLQSIDAGAAFRVITEREGEARLETIRRQNEEWQRDATKDLAEGRVTEALDAYQAAGMVHGAETTKEAAVALIDQWEADRAETESQLILTQARADVAILNDLARERLRAAGELGEDKTIRCTTYQRNDVDELDVIYCNRDFANGDRVLFTKNNRQLDVQNGSLGTALSVETDRFVVSMDDGRTVEFNPADYGFIEPGYAMTVHKAQGSTVDQTYVLATDRFDAHLAYVSMSRHRDRLDLFYGADDFDTRRDLALVLSLEQPNETTLDYEVLRDQLMETARTAAPRVRQEEIDAEAEARRIQAQKILDERAAAALAQVAANEPPRQVRDIEHDRD